MTAKKTTTKSAGMKELEKNDFPTHLVMGFDSEDVASSTTPYNKIANHMAYVSVDWTLQDEVETYMSEGNEYIVVYEPTKIIKVSKTTKEIHV